MAKYNIYIICKNEEIFLQKCKDFDNYKSKICHIQWIPAEYLKLTQCNKKLLKDLNTRYNTQNKKILAKLGTIAAHRKALLAIFSSKVLPSYSINFPPGNSFWASSPTLVPSSNITCNDSEGVCGLIFPSLVSHKAL